MPKGKATDRDAVSAIQLLTRSGLSPREVRDQLKGLCPTAGVPNMAVVYKWIRAMPESSGQQRWTPGAPGLSQDDDALVLETLGHVLHETEGRRSFLTVDEAQQIARIRRLAPAVAPFEAFALAHEYLLLPETDGAARGGVDAYLAFRSAYGGPGGEWRERYGQALSNGSVLPGPFWWDIADRQWRRRIFGEAGMEGAHG